MLRRTASRKRNRGVVPKTGVSRAATNKSEKIDIENVNHPGHVTRVDAYIYQEMKQAFLKVLPKASPGLTEAEIRDRVIAHLSQNLFPEGAKAGWWTKAVQLDLEAKGIVAREKTSPLRWRKV